MAVLRGLGATLELDESSHGWKAIPCPFHDDRAASASYNTTLERFRCHKCGDDISGDGYDVIMGVERCDFLTAKSRATEICGQEFRTTTASGNGSKSFERSKLTSKRNPQRAKLIRQKYSR